MQARSLHQGAAELAEGPVWRRETNEIIWVDILRGEIWATRLDGTSRLVRRHSTPVGAVALTVSGAILAATPIGLVDEAGVIRAHLPMTASDVRANDGKADPAGRFLAGTMTVGEARTGAGALWSLADGQATELVDGATISNGLAWSASGETLYWIDTPTQRIDAFDYDLATGRVSERRTVVVIDESWGAPDGMCIDESGRLWVALWGGGAVRVFDGARCVDVVEVPTPLVTCPAFVGPDRDQLAVTTASIDVPPGTGGAGDLFLVDEPGAVGAEPSRLGPWAE